MTAPDAPRTQTNEQAVRELYFYDVHVSDAQYGRMIEDAIERDRQAAEEQEQESLREPPSEIFPADRWAGACICDDDRRDADCPQHREERR